MEDESKNYVARTPGKVFYAGWVSAVVLAFVATAGLVLARDLWLGRQTAQRDEEVSAGPRVLVAPVLRSSRIREIKLPGEIHGFVETQIYAKIAGYMKTIRVDKGDRVKQGQIMAILESPELDQQVVNARANYQIAKLTDDRNQVLARQGVVAQQVADDSRAAMLQARAALESLIATQAYEIIKAPFTGIVTARYLDPGALIPQATTPSNGTTPIIAMATLSPLRIYASFPQSSAPFVKDGDAATITVTEYPEREFKGTVTRHPDALDSATRTMLVEVDLENRDRALYPGMYAQMAIRVVIPSSAPSVPDDALVFNRGRVYVPVVRGDRLHLAEVSLGYDDGQMVEVTKGLEGNEMVALNVGQSALEGEQVQPLPSDNGAQK